MKDDFFRKLDEIKAFRAESQQNGGVPLLRLVEVAKQDTDQALIVRQFLLGCYNGSNRFDLTDFRRLDLNLFQDCLKVLAMDYGCFKEIHEYIENGSKLFQSWANGGH